MLSVPERPAQTPQWRVVFRVPSGSEITMTLYREEDARFLYEAMIPACRNAGLGTPIRYGENIT